MKFVSSFQSSLRLYQKALVLILLVTGYGHITLLLHQLYGYFPLKNWFFEDSYPVCGKSFPELRRDQIWMVETKDIEVPKPRIKCAIESIVTKYPNHCLRFVFLIKEKTNRSQLERKLALVRKEFTELNLRFEVIHSREILDQSGLAASRQKIFQSKYYRNQIADIARIWLVHKFGGIYFDSDIIIQRKFQELTGENFFIRSNDNDNGLNSAVLSSNRNPLLLRLVHKAFRRVDNFEDYFVFLNAFQHTVNQYCANYCNVMLTKKVTRDMDKGKPVF